ncbi:hypothetical protein [Carboxydothermus hydrogenoformans]|uniref:Cytochrome c n=1 Tax=Carboxydothermus hydrogenoformans (strain ATCC BAA-161 / DSM 6008 / Z-2901) TaxID=246194 RepID=Q3AED1_CARHZ|nr:hypothetical protein [Carboxydothermus hydrogenoformans]ABB14641.1 hypothetical protein CHY_0647 [Carboxydothermus hydrogenoformans Z-2901]
MRKRYKVSLIAVITCLALLLTAAAAFGYRQFAKDPMTQQSLNCATTCHYTQKASDIGSLPYAKVVNYAIVKNIFSLAKGKFYPKKPITNKEFHDAVEKAAGNTTLADGIIPEDNKNFNRSKLADYLARLTGATTSGYLGQRIKDFNGNRNLAWAIYNGYIPISKTDSNNNFYAYPSAMVTRAEAAYAIVTAGLIRANADSKPTPVANNSKHRDITQDFLTWVQNNPTGTSAEFCLTCHGPGTGKWNSIKNIVYTNHYLNRTFTKNGDTIFWMAYQFGQMGNPKLPLDLYMNQDNLHNAARQNPDLAQIEGFREVGFGPGQLQFGMYNRLCGAPETFGYQSFLGRWVGTSGSRAAGCGRCHIGYGIKSGPADPNYNTGLFNQLSGDVDFAILEYVKDIDCLLCHADQYYVSKGAARNVKVVNGKATIYTVGEVYNGQDPSITNPQQKVLTAIASVYKKPTANGCAVCHDFPADGPAYKRGFWHDLDVHLKDDKLSCVDCHPGGAWTPALGDTTGQGVYNKHQFVIGPMPDLYTPNDGQRAKQCVECHTGTVHANQVINDHGRRLDCRTCHISKDYGLDFRDFSNPEREAADGIYEPKDYVFNNWSDSSLYNNNSHEYRGSYGTPTLNFKRQDYEHMMRFGVRPIGDIFDEGKLLGSMGKMNYPQNPAAKIQPFHRVNIKIPMAFGDVYFKAIGKDFANFPFMLPFDKKYYAETGDIIQSVYQGIYKLKTSFMPAYDMSNQIYFGEQKVPKYDGYTAHMIYFNMLNENIMTNPRMSMTPTSKGNKPFNMSGYFEFYGLMQMDHTILPASEALTCVDCHSATGRVAIATDSWKSLGYSAKRSQLLIFTKK